MAKARSEGVPKVSTSRVTRPEERLCKDISGPNKKSIVGNDYWILIVDDYSGKAWSYLVKKKSQMGTIVEDLLMILKTASYNVQYLRCDDTGEPRTYKKALEHQDVANWKLAIKGEIDNFYKSDVWKKVPGAILKGRKSLITRWAFKCKTEQDKSFR